MNEIKKGYKQTDIGVIPEDWEVTAICDGIAEAATLVHKELYSIWN